MKKRPVIGITGGPASGKSLVAREFKRLGADVIDADRVAREVLAPGKEAYKEVVRAFGSGVLRPDGTIDRKALAKIVFSDPERLALLNSITHPPIIEIIKKRISVMRRSEAKGPVVVDAPLLFETGLDTEMDAVIVVRADMEEMVRRIMARDGLSRSEALSRIGAQMPVDEKARRADYVIDSSKDPDRTRAEARRLYEVIGGKAPLPKAKKGVDTEKKPC